jgi:hypothetical protein
MPWLGSPDSASTPSLTIAMASGGVCVLSNDAAYAIPTHALSLPYARPE